MTTLAVSHKCIPEWLSISSWQCLQDWGLVYWEAACLVWSVESCVTAAQCSCARVVHWKVKVTSSLTDVWQQLFDQQDITVIVLCTIHFHHWLHENHTSAPAPGDMHRLKPKCRNTFIRNQRGTSMSWNGIWLKYGQQPAELHWSVDRSVTRLFYWVSQSQKQTLWTFAMMCFSVICNCHDF